MNQHQRLLTASTGHFVRMWKIHTSLFSFELWVHVVHRVVTIATSSSDSYTLLRFFKLPWVWTHSYWCIMSFACEDLVSQHQPNQAPCLLTPTLSRRRMVLQSLSGFSFSVSPRLLQLVLCCCSSQHTHTPSLSNLSWGGGGGNTHPHSCMHATYTENTQAHTRTKSTRTDTCTDQTWAWCVAAM